MSCAYFVEEFKMRFTSGVCNSWSCGQRFFLFERERKLKMNPTFVKVANFLLNFVTMNMNVNTHVLAKFKCSILLFLLCVGT